MDTDPPLKSKVRKRKAALNASFCVKKERNTLYQKVSTILQKPTADRSKDEIECLDNSSEIVEQIALRRAQRQKVKDRAQEYEDPVDVLSEKCKTLAEAVINSNHLVVYTGAGISTAACIPDYRGSNGIWTLLQQGKDIGSHDLSQAEPTLTHMALYCLYRSGILKHVVSQNCDGLHLRSGIPRNILSEVHGNMYLEVCSKCKPSNLYLRLFDVTEYTARYSHETLRLCYKCGSPLKDTIVHFGERGKLQWPLNWDTACKQADKADVILCLGSSLKVLKRYPWLWCMEKPVKKRPKLYIVNLQWTPKDDQSTLKINGKCDAVIELMMSHLGLTIPSYVRTLDPIFYHATNLHESETHTTSRVAITRNLPKPSVAAMTCSTSLGQTEEKPLCDSSDKPDNNQECDTGASAIDLTSSNNPNGVQVKKESLVEDSFVPDSSNTVPASQTNPTSGLSANIKTESLSDESSNVNSTVLENRVKEIDDEVKEEASTDTSSDKENDEITNVDMKVETTTEVDAGLKVERIGTDEATAGTVMKQSSVTIKEEVTDSPLGSTNEAISASETMAAAENALPPAVESMQTFPNSLNLLCGRSLWSDLSVFANQPILFGHSILGWSDMNSYTYSSAALSDVSNCARNGDETASSSSTTATALVTTELAKDKPCLFCMEYYCSRSCLFYASSGSNAPLDMNSACLCCGGDEDDEEQQEEPEEEDDKTPARVPSVNPGWFGKGCRKKVKYKRR